jgi:hypothetical protein
MSIHAPATTDPRRHPMSEAYLTNWLVDRCATGSPSHFHEVALREARIATERNASEPDAPVRQGFVARVRFAFARPATDTCNCPA